MSSALFLASLSHPGDLSVWDAVFQSSLGDSGTTHLQLGPICYEICFQILSKMKGKCVIKLNVI